MFVKNISVDIVYDVDPSYSSRQYSRFYHVLETLIKYDKSKLCGVGLKSGPENMSDYCRNNVKHKFSELVKDIKAECLVVSYSNTYDSKDDSPRNKITLKEIQRISMKRDSAKIIDILMQTALLSKIARNIYLLQK
jgi:adenine-specific DNA-methyltransferase